MIDISMWDKRNIWVNQAGQMVVREGMQRILGAWALDLKEFFGGFSVENPRTSDQVHYILGADSNEETYIYVCNQEFYPVARVFVGTRIKPDGPFQGGVLGNGQILCGAPGMPMFWGYVGNGLKLAERTNSALDVDFTTQTINDGLVASWQNRIVIGVRDALYFSDTGSPRAFLAANTTPAPGFIHFLKVSESGFLFMGTTNGVYTIAADSVYSGEVVQPTFQKVSEYPINGFYQACLTDMGPVALSVDGIINVSAYNGEELRLGDKRITRTLAEPVHFEDYRVGKIFATNTGPALTIAAEQDLDSATYFMARVYEKKKMFSWIDAARQGPFHESLEIRGILEDSDGSTYFLSDESIFRFFGNVDSVGDDPIGRFVLGVLSGQVPVDPQMNPVIRAVTTESDNIGTLQYVSLQGTQKSATPTNHGNLTPVCDVTRWADSFAPSAAANQYYTRRLQSIRHLFSIRTNDMAMEVGVEGSGFRIGLVSFKTKGPGMFRPQDGQALIPATLEVDP